MLNYALRPHFAFRIVIIFATTTAMVLPPQSLLAPAFATPPPPPPPGPPPENPCLEPCSPDSAPGGGGPGWVVHKDGVTKPGAPGSPGSSGDACSKPEPPCEPCPAPPGRSEGIIAYVNHPIVLSNGGVRESVTDLSLPGPLVSWSQRRSYDSRLTNASMTQLGRNWLSGNGDIRLVDAGSGNIALITSASSKRTFKYASSTYTAPTGSDLTLEAVGDTLLMTHITSGDIHIFNDFSHGEESGRLIEHTTRAWKAALKTGVQYQYDQYGRTETIITAGEQAEEITIEYTSISSWQIDWIRVGIGGSYYMEVDYKYGFESGTHADCGADDDLVQVLVRKKGTDGNWIERYTQYRYYTSSPLDGKLKSVLESDAIQRIIDSGYTGITTPANILNTADSYTTGTLGSLPALSTRVSRSFTYYTSNQPTNTTSPNDYETVYGNHDGTNSLDVDETGYCASETVNGDCASCGGGSGTGLLMEYHYVKGKYFNSYDPADITTNPTWDGDINIVCSVVIEDIKSGASLLRRNVYGLSKDGFLLRKATMESPGSTAIWCTSNLMRNDHRLSEWRMPSAHVSTDSPSELKTFLNPYDGSTTYDNTLDDGLIYVYDYNSSGWETDAKVKKGPSGTAYYVSATNYGDGMSAAVWDVVATYEYPTSTVTRTAGIATTYGYTYWSGTGFDRKSVITTTREAVPTTQNGSSVSIATSQYFDEAGRLRWTKDGEGYVNYYSYHPYTGELTYTSVDVNDPSTPGTEISNGDASGPSGIDVKWLRWTTDGADLNYPTRGSGLPTGLALVTKREFDNQGRLRKTTDPGGSLDYISYQNNYVAYYSHWNVGTANTLLPIQVTVLNNGGVATESLSIIGTSSAVSKPSSEPLGISSPARTDFTSWTRNFHSLANGQLVKSLRYHLIPASDDEHITHYYVTAFAYDAFGRQTTTVQTSTSSVDQVTRRVYDFLDRPTSTERVAHSSSIDTGINSELGSVSYADIEEVASTVYDGGGVGDGHVTKTKQNNDLIVGSYTLTNYHRTFRGHVRGIERQYYNGTSTSDVTPYTALDIDWMGRTTGSALYTTTEPIWSTLTGGYADYLASNSSGRNEWTKTYFDNLGLTYRTERHPGTEATKYFEVNYYYDRNGRLVAMGDKYSAHTESAYDGAGRHYQQRAVTALESDIATYGKFTSGGAFNYVEPAPNPALASMDTTGDEGLIEFSHTVYETDGHPTEQHTFELNHTDTDGIDIDSTTSYVRRSVFSYYDAADRVITTTVYGTGDGTSSSTTWSYTNRPSRATSPVTGPTWTDSLVYNGYVLLTKYDYDVRNGRMDTVTTGVSQNGSDTKTIATKTFFDALSRSTAVAENWVDATANGSNAGGGTNNEQDRVTKFAYNGVGQHTQITAINVTSGGPVDQETNYYYEDPYNASLLTHTTYPDSSSTPSSGSDLVELEYNLDGSLKKKTDQRGVVIDYTYDAARRLEKERATNFGGSGAVDSSVKSIVHLYDSLGRLASVTSYANDDGTGTVRNQLAYTYDATYGNLTKTEQSHENAVTGGTPSVQYAYDDTVSSNVFTHGQRQKMVTYPDGRKVHSTYSSSGSIADVLGRIDKLEDNLGGTPGTDLVGYTYNGTSRLVKADFYAPDIESRAYNLDGTGGDNNYNAFDRFGREVKREWWKYVANQFRDRFDYTLDYAGNRLSRDIPGSVYATNIRDQAYGYDGLQQLKSFDEGTLSSGSISGTPTREENWTLDQLGNWPGFVQKAAGSTTLDQTRYHNAVNEIDGNSGNSITASTGTNWADPAYDAAGNMTTMPKPAALTAAFTLKYDAWNRLVEVKDGANTVQTNEFDGLGRRIVRVNVAANPDVTYDDYYNEQWQLLEERKNADTDPLNQYLWHPYYIDALAIRWYDADTDGNLAENVDGEYYCLHDANYNVTAITDNSGAVVERYAYTPYGGVTVLDANFATDSDGVSDIGNTHFYTGRELDSETGLQLNRRRFYAPHLGRWSIRDPKYMDSFNLCEYVRSNAINSVDYSGRANVRSCLNLSGTPQGEPYCNCKLVPKPGAPPCAVNGCSWSPDFPAFVPCCDSHDKCYCQCTSGSNSQAKCDRRFCDCLLTSCDYQPWYGYSACKAAAFVYCAAVINWDSQYYIPKKEDHCDCDCSGN